MQNDYPISNENMDIFDDDDDDDNGKNFVLKICLV